MRRAWVQVAVGLAFWAVLLLLWVLLVVEGKAPGRAVLESLVTLVVAGAFVGALTGLWVRHNTRIYRRKGPRQARPVTLPRTDVDRLGRRLVWDLPGGALAAQTCGHLVVDVQGQVKTYGRGLR